MKRGQGAQFNWIFVLIAGGIVLGFFVMFTFRYVDLENKKNTVLVGEYLFNGLEILETTQVDTVIDLIYYSDLKFSCGKTNKLVINDYYVQSLDEIIFAPSEIKSNRLNTWMKTWRSPFKIANFIYISSPYDKYILVNPPEWVDIPKTVNIEIVSRGNKIKNATRIVFFERPQISDIEDIRDRVIVIGENKIRFFNKKDPKDVEIIDDDVFKYGAIFSDNVADYECNVEKALERLRLMGKIYSSKAYVLSIIDNRNECDYGFIRNQLDEISEGKVNKEFIEGMEKQNLDLIGRGCYNVF